MEPNDPFSSLLEACRMSPSNESSMQDCSYFGASDSESVSDAAYRNPADSFGIAMLSPPVSPEEEDVFQTPPESRSTTASSDSRMVRNSLDRDGETVPVVLEMDKEETRVSKRLRSLDVESPSGVRERSPEMSNTDSEGLLEWLKDKAVSRGGTPESELQNQPSHEVNFEADVLRKDLECDTEEADTERKAPNGSNPRATKEETESHDRSSASSGCWREKFQRIKEVLLQLEENLEEDTSVYGLTLLEVAEAKWGPFPSRRKS
ncbi:hypothetical protein V6N13_062402 [Hibiscus sabdariffa]|uniref:Uncharacterized protein n=2 Tax=Hibiscus sabdariffa TaxID=183260 RepID=A0ABR2BQD0_9ROSI